MENVLFTSSSRFYYLLESFARTYEFRSWYSRKFSRLVNTPTKIKFQDVCWFVTEGNRKPSTTARQNFYGRGGGGRYKIYNRICPVLRWLLIFINIHITAHIVYNINFATLTLSFLSKCYIILILFSILI